MTENSTFTTTLLDLTSLEDVLAAIIFRIDGEILKFRQKDETMVNRNLFSVLSWCKKNVKGVSLEMKKNNLTKVTYELNNTIILFFIINNTSILTVIAVENANLSLLSIEAKRVAVILSQEF